MAINKVFKEMFKEQKKQKELEHQKEIIKKALEGKENMFSDFDKGIDFLEEGLFNEAYTLLKKCADNGNIQAQYEVAKLLKEGKGVEKDIDLSKEYLMKSYKNGFKKSGLVLREIRYNECKDIVKKSNTEFEIRQSELGYIIDIPKNWVELESKNKNCFDTIAVDKINDDVIFNIKMQVFLIEVPDNMALSVSLDRVANNMGCSESIDFNNKNCDGKLICGEGLDGTCNYIFLTKGRRGVYDLRVMVDKYLEPIYEDVIDHIIYSFKVTDL